MIKKVNRLNSFGPAMVILLTLLLLCMGMTNSVIAGPAEKGMSQDRNYAPDSRDNTGPDGAYVQGELVIKLGGCDSVVIDDICQKYGASVNRYFEDLGIYVLNVNGETDHDSLCSIIESYSCVVFAHPNYRVDPLQPVQGSFPFSDENFAGDYRGQFAATALDLSSAQAIATGAGVRIAVIDGGINYRHPAFEGKAVSGYDFVDDDADAFDESGGPNTGHGTFIAGVIHLVAPDAEIVAYRVSETSGTSDGDLVAEAIVKAVHDGCQVINLSLVVMEEHQVIKAAIEYARENNVIVVVAAGNEQMGSPLYPASDENVIAVAALDSLDQLAEFSRYGSHIDVCAFGEDVYSPFIDTGYAWWSGTSFAAPFVAGQAGLIISQAPEDYTWSHTRQMILETAVSVDAENPDFAGYLGAGVIAPYASLTVSLESDSAWLWEDNKQFTINEGDPDIGPVCLMVSSTNEPAPFTVALSGEATFTTLRDSRGYTGDTLCFDLGGSALSPGYYADTLIFEVEGVDNNPLMAVFELQVNTDTAASDLAWVYPKVQQFTMYEGDETALVRSVSISSSNSPAPYTATLVNDGLFTDLLWDSGMTNDTLSFTVSAVGLTPNVYTDSLSISVEGISSPAWAVIVLQVLPHGTPLDTAWVSSDDLYFEAAEGSSWVDSSCVRLMSTNAPAPYTAYVVGGESSFVSLLNLDGGVTEDYICYIIDPTGLGTGVHRDSMVITVEGVSNSPLIVRFTLNIVGGGDTLAAVSPDTLFFTVVQGDTHVRTGCACLTSFNAPSPYIGINDTDAVFTTLISTAGVTNDTVCLLVDPSLMPVGVHYSRAMFFVDGVAERIDLITCLTVVDEIGPDTAWVSNDSLGFWVEEGTSWLDTGCVLVSSTNASAFYTAEAFGDPLFLSLVDSVGSGSGFTNSLVCFQINHQGLPLGVYKDSLIIDVEGVTNSPLVVPITLTVFTADTLVDISPDTLSFTATQGDTEVMTGRAWLSSFDPPKPYVAILDTGAVFTSLVDVAGMTDDSVYVQVDPSGVPTGVHYEHVIYCVDENLGTARLTIRLTVEPSGGTTPDSAFVDLDTLCFTVTENANDSIVGYVRLFSSNAPAAFNAVVNDSATFIVWCVNGSGFTDDSVCVCVLPWDIGVGTHYTSISYFVEGVAEPARLVVCLTVEGAEHTTVDLRANFPNPFNPVTNISFALSNPATVELSVYNVLGRKVATLINGDLPAGEHIVDWDGTDNTGRGVSSGVYFYRLTTGSFSESKKMLLLK